MALLEARGIVKEFRFRDRCITVLKDASISVQKGEIVALLGPSGSGKTTFVSILGGLDRPTSGSVWLEGTAITALAEKRLARLRNSRIGFVFQSFNLIPGLTALENVELPRCFGHCPEGVRSAREWLELLGLGHRLSHFPAELSGGEQQRVAIARALVNDPAVVLMDEPTGNLDSLTAEEVLDTILDLRRRSGTAFVVVTHNPAVASRADRVMHIRDGVVTASA
ncbi:MAG: ABC transporter ATP-binding protein [Acetobacteraceae bacterium]|nr:ABC transporter ATP-binding protein [Acetobacteraceae bacterium]